MQQTQYCLNEPILSVQTAEGHRECVYVPAGEVVYVLQPDPANNKFVRVAWDHKTVLMFEQDLHDRAERIAVAA